MTIKDSIYRVGIILIAFLLICCEEKEHVEPLSDNSFDIGEQIIEENSECIDRDQLEIQRAHMGLAADLLSLFTEKLSESEFRNQASNVLEKMYQNFCKGETLTFHGKIGNIERAENVTNLQLRIDDMISSDQNEYLFVYQSTVRMLSDVGMKLVSDFGNGDLIQYEFSISSFFEPRNRSQAVELIMNGEAGSFPVDRMWDGVDDTFPSGEYYILPITISVTEITSIAELFTQHRNNQESIDRENDSRTKNHTAQEHFEKALELEENQDFQIALNYLNQAIELSPEFAEAYEARGGIKYVLQDLQGALNDLQKAIELKPQFKEAYVTLAIVKMGLGYNIENICSDLATAEELGSNAPLINWERCQ